MPARCLIQMVHLLPEDLAVGIEICDDGTDLSQDVGPAESRRHHHEDADPLLSL